MLLRFFYPNYIRSCTKQHQMFCCGVTMWDLIVFAYSRTVCIGLHRTMTLFYTAARAIFWVHFNFITCQCRHLIYSFSRITNPWWITWNSKWVRMTYVGYVLRYRIFFSLNWKRQLCGFQKRCIILSSSESSFFTKADHWVNSKLSYFFESTQRHSIAITIVPRMSIKSVGLPNTR